MKQVITSYVLPIGATPVLQAILNYIGLLNLKPLAHWEMPPDSLPLITYLVAAGFGALACFCSDNTKGKKKALLLIPMVLLVISYLAYIWVSRTPPPISRVELIDDIGYAAFFLTYVCYGFLVARVVKAFATKLI